MRWVKLVLEVLARLFKWREDSQVKKAVLYDLEQESQEREQRAQEVDNEVDHADLADLHERMRHYRRD